MFCYRHGPLVRRDAAVDLTVGDPLRHFTDARSPADMTAFAAARPTG